MRVVLFFHTLASLFYCALLTHFITVINVSYHILSLSFLTPTQLHFVSSVRVNISIYNPSGAPGSLLVRLQERTMKPSLCRTLRADPWVSVLT